jgi:hypothetical protein
MAYVDKLVDTQDAIMHDFNGEDHNDGGTRSRKRSGESYVTDPSRPSTFLEGDFNMVMDDQCQFHLVMATGKICADIYYKNPRQHTGLRSRTRARYPQRARSHTRACYPRIAHAREHARVPTTTDYPTFRRAPHCRLPGAAAAARHVSAHRH